MADIFNEDFQDFLKALGNQQVEYVLVGGYSVILHGYFRTTGDLDVWVNRTIENYRKLKRAFSEFGMPVFDMTQANFLDNPAFDVFTFGRPPVSIDVITSIKGLSFETSFERAALVDVEGINVRLIHFQDLLTAKRAAGRPRDLNDLENLEPN